MSKPKSEILFGENCDSPGDKQVMTEIFKLLTETMTPDNVNKFKKKLEKCKDAINGIPDRNKQIIAEYTGDPKIDKKVALDKLQALLDDASTSGSDSGKVKLLRMQLAFRKTQTTSLLDTLKKINVVNNNSIPQIINATSDIRKMLDEALSSSNVPLFETKYKEILETFDKVISDMQKNRDKVDTVPQLADKDQKERDTIKNNIDVYIEFLKNLKTEYVSNEKKFKEVIEARLASKPPPGPSKPPPGPSKPPTPAQVNADAAADASDRADALSQLDIKILLNNNAKITGLKENVIANGVFTELNNPKTKPETKIIIKTPTGYPMVQNTKEKIINDEYVAGAVGGDIVMKDLVEYKPNFTKKSVMLFGSSGSGKTFNAKRIIKELYEGGFALENIKLYYKTMDINLATSEIKVSSDDTFNFSELVPTPGANSKPLKSKIKKSFDEMKDQFFNNGGDDPMKRAGDIIDFTTLINRQKGYVRQTINNPQSSRGATVYEFTKVADGKTFYLIDAPGSEDPFTILQGIFQYIRLDFLVGNVPAGPGGAEQLAPHAKLLNEFFGKPKLEVTDVSGKKSIVGLTSSIEVLNKNFISGVSGRLPDKGELMSPWKGQENGSKVFIDGFNDAGVPYVDITKELDTRLKKIVVQLFMNYYTNSDGKNYSANNIYDFIPKSSDQLTQLIDGTQKNMEDYRKIFADLNDKGFIIGNDVYTQNLFLGQADPGGKQYGPTNSVDIKGTQIKDTIFKIIDSTRELITQSYYITFQIGYISSIIRNNNDEIKKDFDQQLPIMFFKTDGTIKHFDKEIQERFGYYINDSEFASLNLKSDTRDYSSIHSNENVINLIDSGDNKNLFPLGRDIFLQKDIDIMSLVVIPKKAQSEDLVKKVISLNTKSIFDQLLGKKKPGSGGGSILGGKYSKLKIYTRKRLHSSGKIRKRQNYKIKIKNTINTKKRRKYSKKMCKLVKTTIKRKKIKKIKKSITDTKKKYKNRRNKNQR